MGFLKGKHEITGFDIEREGEEKLSVTLKAYERETVGPSEEYEATVSDQGWDLRRKADRRDAAEAAAEKIEAREKENREDFYFAFANGRPMRGASAMK